MKHILYSEKLYIIYSIDNIHLDNIHYTVKQGGVASAMSKWRGNRSLETEQHDQNIYSVQNTYKSQDMLKYKTIISTYL